MNLEDLSAIVTGGAQGIGEATSWNLARSGVRVAILDHSEKKAEEVAQSICKAGLQAAAFRTDVTDKHQVDHAVEKVAETFGGIHVLVNNVGWTEHHSFMDDTEEYWHKVISINLTSMFLVSQSVLKVMIPQKFGKIVNISSEAGRIGNPGEVAYSAAKGGIIASTKSLAREMARHNITVNCICPGPTLTPLLSSQPRDVIDGLEKLIPLRRISEPHEVANVIGFFCSHKSSFVTGQIISVSGGLTMSG